MLKRSALMGSVALALMLGLTQIAAAQCDARCPNDVPEPDSLWLIGIAITGALWVARKRR